MSAKKPKFLSLFSGCGGLDLGFHQAGFEGILSVDNDATALAVHSKNIGGEVRQMDLSNEDPHVQLMFYSQVRLAKGSLLREFAVLTIHEIHYCM
jgi:site-specific DNA-cytosine methylase